jgi:hypothetical protein
LLDAIGLKMMPEIDALGRPAGVCSDVSSRDMAYNSLVCWENISPTAEMTLNHIGR